MTNKSVHRSVSDPIRTGRGWDERWRPIEAALVTCWERGREKGHELPDLAVRAKNGELPILPWKGGVEKATKQKHKFGSLHYLAMWQGLRGEDLNIPLDEETTWVCTRTRIGVTFTPDATKYSAIA